MSEDKFWQSALEEKRKRDLDSELKKAFERIKAKIHERKKRDHETDGRDDRTPESNPGHDPRGGKLHWTDIPGSAGDDRSDNLPWKEPESG